MSLKYVSNVYEKSEFVFLKKIKLDKNSILMSGLNEQDVLENIKTELNGIEIGQYYRNGVKIPIILKGQSHSIRNFSIYSETKNK